MSEVIIVMGINAAGKTTLVSQFTNSGYLRLNRDTEGGKLDGLAVKAAVLISQGVNNMVLDNT